MFCFLKQTIERYTHFLESSYLIFTNKIFKYSLKKQLSNPRKVYFIDNGLRNAVSFIFKDMYENLLENAVYLELLKQEKEIYYFKEKYEVDFVIKENSKVKSLINVCYGMSDFKTREREIRSLIECLKKFNLKEGTIITFNDEEIINFEGKRIKVVPFYKKFYC